VKAGRRSFEEVQRIWIVLLCCGLNGGDFTARKVNSDASSSDRALLSGMAHETATGPETRGSFQTRRDVDIKRQQVSDGRMAMADLAGERSVISLQDAKRVRPRSLGRETEATEREKAVHARQGGRFPGVRRVRLTIENGVSSTPDRALSLLEV